MKYLSLILCLALLSQCTNVDRNHQLKPLQSPYNLTANAYMAMASNQTGEERQALMLLAVGRRLDEGNWPAAQKLLSQTKPKLPANIDKKNLFQAKIDLMQKKPARSIKHLGAIKSPEALCNYDQILYHETLANTYKALGNTLEAIKERITLERIMPDSSAKADNRRILWLMLISQPKAELTTIMLESREGSVLQGWAKLALIARQNPGQPQKMLDALEDWEQVYPNHPARQLLPAHLSHMNDALFKKPSQIALLLPVSGPLSGPAHAIQDGFFAALRAKGDEHNTTVRIYDTQKIKPKRAYLQALSDGAEYVIGPLTKKDISKIAGLSHPVPTLFLNHIANSNEERSFQFGLSPINEARQVAVKARQAALSKALIIAPEGPWGDEILQAFASEWGQSRGQVMDTLRFDPNQPEALNESIRGLLNAVTDDERRQQLKKLKTNPDLDFGPLRREDFDVIFLLAYPSNARQIMPLLRYYYAGKIPVYGTSSVYTGTQNTVADRDLDGIIFCDMPWVFKHPGMKTKDWPEGLNSYTRLYALGMDSYALSTELNALMLFPALGRNNQTGALYLTQDHVISRILPFAQFQNGIAQLIN